VRLQIPRAVPFPTISSTFSLFAQIMEAGCWAFSLQNNVGRPAGMFINRYKSAASSSTLDAASSTLAQSRCCDGAGALHSMYRPIWPKRVSKSLFLRFYLSRPGGRKTSCSFCMASSGRPRRRTLDSHKNDRTRIYSIVAQTEILHVWERPLLIHDQKYHTLAWTCQRVKCSCGASAPSACAVPTSVRV